MSARDMMELDCTKGGNKVFLSELLWKLKPIQNVAKKNNIKAGGIVPIEILEEVLHGISIRYGYQLETITSYYETDFETNKKKFVYFCCYVTNREKKFCSNYFAKTSWGIFAKGIIRIYADIKNAMEGDILQ